jgi:signal recognition particle receptor subunit alpha
LLGWRQPRPAVAAAGRPSADTRLLRALPLQGLGLVFVAVYQKSLSLLYVDELLQLVKDKFTPGYKPSVYEYRDFDDAFKHLLKQCEERADQAKRGAAAAKALPGAAQKVGAGRRPVGLPSVQGHCGRRALLPRR